MELLILSARISWSFLLANIPFLSSPGATPCFLFANNLYFLLLFLKHPSVQGKECKIPKNQDKGISPLALKRSVSKL